MRISITSASTETLDQRPRLDQGRGVVTYRDVVRHKEMPAILTAHGVSLTGSVAAEVALSVLIYSRTSSPLLSSLTLACAFVPQAFSAFVLSGVVDRVPPRRLLVTIDLVCAVLVGCMTISDAHVGVLLLLATGVGVVTPLFAGARSAALADVLEGEVWVRSRSLLRILSQSSLLLGFAVGGVALTVVSPRVLLALDAASFVASALLLRLGTSERPARSTQRTKPSLKPLRHPGVLPVLLMTWIPAACVCAIDGLATPYASPSTVGIAALLASAAAGTILAELLGRHVTRPMPVALLTGAGLLLFALHPPVWLAVPCVLLAMQGGAIGQYLDARLLDAMPEEVRGRLMALQQGLFMGIQGAAIALAGALAEVFEPHQVLAGAGVVAVLTVVLVLPQVSSPPRVGV
jgi:predicted MFS family arabinose efflux permease